MKEVHLRFILHYSDPAECPACINEPSRWVKLNLPQIANMARIEQMTFVECFTACISHELMHQILYDTEGDSASEDFDNICQKKYKKVKNWIGGVGCE